MSFVAQIYMTCLAEFFKGLIWGLLNVCQASRR